MVRVSINKTITIRLEHALFLQDPKNKDFKLSEEVRALIDREISKRAWSCDLYVL